MKVRREVFFEEGKVWARVHLEDAEITFSEDFKGTFKISSEKKELPLLFSCGPDVLTISLDLDEGPTPILAATWHGPRYSCITESLPFDDPRELSVSLFLSIGPLKIANVLGPYFKVFRRVRKWKKELGEGRIKKGLCWGEYIRSLPPEEMKKIEALRNYIDAYKLYEMTGAEYQRLGFYKFFEKRLDVTMTMRAWGGMMAAIMNDYQGEKVYGYATFAWRTPMIYERTLSREEVAELLAPQLSKCVLIWGDFFFLPSSPEDLRELAKFKEVFSLLEGAGAGDLFAYKADLLPEFRYGLKKDTFTIFRLVAERILGRKIEAGETLSFEEAKKCVDYVFFFWTSEPLFSFFKLASKELVFHGWFIWQDALVSFPLYGEEKFTVPLLSEDLARECLRLLEILRETKAERFFSFKADFEREICIYNCTLHIYKGLASKALGREVKDGEELDVKEAERCLRYLLGEER